MYPGQWQNQKANSNDYMGTATVNRTKLEILAVLSQNLCLIKEFDPKSVIFISMCYEAFSENTTPHQ